MRFYFMLVMICICACVCGQNITEQSHKTGDNLAINYLQWKFHTAGSDSPQNYSKIMELCRSFIVEFGKQASQFIECSVDNARPFRFCEGCVEYYEKTMTVYKDIQQDDEHMSNCRQLLLNSDRVQIITSIYEDIKTIWESAECDKCFDWMSEDDNGTVTYALKDITKQFVILYSNFTDCIPEMEALNETVCDMCSRYYTDMKTMFDHKLLVDPDSPHPVCMDIVDMMNYTRLLWGATLNCTKVHKELAPIISIAGVVLAVPVVFYISLRVYGDRKTKQLMSQKRFTHSGTDRRNNSNASLNSTQDTDSSVEHRHIPSLYSLHSSPGSINSLVTSNDSPIPEIIRRTNTVDTS